MCVRGGHKALGGRLAILGEKKLNSRTFQGECFKS